MTPKKRASRRPLRTKAAAAIVAALALPALDGCSSNALPQIPVPKPNQKAALPPWYPEKPWTASGGKSRVYIEGKIVFDTDKSTIRPGKSEEVLKKLLAFLNEHPEVTLLRVEGHTDSTAGDEHNQELSANRSLTVCDWLVDQGVDNTRLLAVGFGSSKPIAPNERADGRQENRRTEFHVQEVNGRPFMKTGKDPTTGGYVLLVKSKEEREKEKELAAAAAQFPRVELKPFQPTGDEVHVKEAGPQSSPTIKPRDKDKKPQGGS